LCQPGHDDECPVGGKSAYINADDLLSSLNENEGGAIPRLERSRLMDAATRGLVRGRAEDRCKYYLLRQRQSGLAHHVEHIIATRRASPRSAASGT
jgi:hypothetical protein